MVNVMTDNNTCILSS